MSKCSGDISIANDVRLVTGLLKKADPVDSVTYDGNNRPTQIVYNTSIGTETVVISYPSGFPTINGVEYRDHTVDIWGAELEPVNEAVTVSIELATGFVTRQQDVSTTPVQITGTSDRISVAIRNWSDLASGLTLYYAEDNTTLEDGWPLAPGEGLALELTQGSNIFLVASSDTIDVRILEVTKS